MGELANPEKAKARRRMGSANKKQPPNIVLVHTRELGRFVEPYPGGVCAPNLRRLAGDGITFTRAYAGALDNAPAGACLFTGQPAHCVGMLGPSLGYSLNDPNCHLANLLKAAGYATASFGYEHFQEMPTKLGFDSHDRCGLGTSDEVAEAVVEFLGKPSSQAPLFVSIGFRETARDSTKLSWVNAPRPADANFIEVVDRTDEALGRILDVLDSQNLAKHTLVIFTTDHGGRCPLVIPQLNDDEFGVAMIMRGPGGFHGGEHKPALVSHLDLVPTALELAGIDIPEHVHGQSLLPLAVGEADEVNEHVVAEVNVLVSGAWPTRILWMPDHEPTRFKNWPLRRLRASASKPEKLLSNWMIETADPLLEKDDFDVPPVLQNRPPEPPRCWLVDHGGGHLPDTEQAWRPCPQNHWQGDLWFNRPIKWLDDLVNWIEWALAPHDEEFGFQRMGHRVKEAEPAALVHNTWLLLNSLRWRMQWPEIPIYELAGERVRVGHYEFARCSPAEAIEHLCRLKAWCIEQIGVRSGAAASEAGAALQPTAQQTENSAAEPVEDADNGKSEANDDVTSPRTKRKPGRPTKCDPGKDQKIFEAWETDEYKTKNDLANALGMKKHEVKRALDRERKRRKKSE